MAPNKAISSSYTADTETDLYTNSSETEYAISLKLSAHNPDSSGHNIELWVTDESNVHQECLFLGAISGETLIMDGSKTLIPPEHKVRFKSDDTDVKFAIHVYEGVT